MVLNGLQHHLNALHVMAHLVRFGLPRPQALALARWWEWMVHPLLYPALRSLIPVCVASPVGLAAEDALADWILDTQPRIRPLDPTALVDYLARQHLELLARLKRNEYLQAELVRPLVAMDPR